VIEKITARRSRAECIEAEASFSSSPKKAEGDNQSVERHDDDQRRAIASALPTHCDVVVVVVVVVVVNSSRRTNPM